MNQSSNALKILQNHPTLLQTQQLNHLCKPLTHLGITTFSHLRVSTDHKLTVLCNHPRSLSNYVQKKYYEADPCVNLKPELCDIGQYLVWDTVQCSGKTAEMLADSSNLDYRHVFTIIKKEPEFTHYYHFGTHIINPSIHLMYINNLDLLDRFITYFKEQTSKFKLLQQAYQIILNVEQKTSCVALHEENILTQLTDKRKMCLRSMLLEDIPNLTSKEIECAKLLVESKTAKQIASKIGVSYRTIEDRINSLKYKMHTPTKSELIAKLLNIMPLYRI